MARRKYSKTKKVYRKGKSRYGGRKWFKKRMRSSKTVSRFFMPDRHFTKLKFSNVINVLDAPTAEGYCAGLNIRANDLYDPEDPLTGYQPRGYDQLSAMYWRYRVYACKIKVKIHSLVATADTPVPYYVAIYPYQVNSTDSARDWLSFCTEQPYSRVVTRNAYDTSQAVSACMSTSKIWGLSKTAVKNDLSFASDIGTGPLNRWFWRISYGQVNPSAVSAKGYAVQIWVTYYAEFFNRRNVDKSA